MLPLIGERERPSAVPSFLLFFKNIVMESTEALIRNLLEEKFEEEGFRDCFIIDIDFAGNSRLNVFIDSDTNITFEKCKKVSRHLEKHLDDNGWLGEKYILEVSSPGVDRPLKYLRQFAKNIGRKLDIKLTDGSKHEGKLMEVAGESILLEEKVKSEEHKNKKVIKETTIPFDQIDRAIVKISFK